MRSVPFRILLFVSVTLNHLENLSAKKITLTNNNILKGIKLKACDDINRSFIVTSSALQCSTTKRN